MWRVSALRWSFSQPRNPLIARFGINCLSYCPSVSNGYSRYNVVCGFPAHSSVGDPDRIRFHLSMMRE
jgi:hypothetical protein